MHILPLTCAALLGASLVLASTNNSSDPFDKMHWVSTPAPPEQNPVYVDAYLAELNKQKAVPKVEPAAEENKVEKDKVEEDELKDDEPL